MNKRFASFMISGKIAAMPLFNSESIATIHKMITSDAQGKPPAGSSESELQRKNRALAHRNVILLPKKAPLAGSAEVFDLVITGLREKDEVMVALSKEKEVLDLLEISPTLFMDSRDIALLSRFSMVADAYRRDLWNDDIRLNPQLASLGAVSLPVDTFVMRDMLMDTRAVYLKVLVAPESDWKSTIIRSTDLYEIRTAANKPMLMTQYGENPPDIYGEVTEDCPSYICY